MYFFTFIFMLVSICNAVAKGRTQRFSHLRSGGINSTIPVSRSPYGMKASQGYVAFFLFMTAQFAFDNLVTLRRDTIKIVII